MNERDHKKILKTNNLFSKTACKNWDRKYF